MLITRRDKITGPKVPAYALFDIAKSRVEGELPLPDGDGHLVIGIESGPHPAVVFMEMSENDTLNVYDAQSSISVTSKEFATETVMPLLEGRYEKRYSQNKYTIVVTPFEGNGVNASDAYVAFQIYSKLFVDRVQFAATHLLHARLAASERFMCSSGKGGLPSLLICDKNASPLVDALQKGYYYKAKNNCIIESTPTVSYPASALVAAFQYGCLFVDNGYTFGCSTDCIGLHPSIV